MDSNQDRKHMDLGVEVGELLGVEGMNFYVRMRMHHAFFVFHSSNNMFLNVHISHNDS